MNLIEQLGGYERAKRIEKNIYGTGGRLIRYPSKDFDYNDDSGSVCDVELISFKANDLKKSLLEYRRQHNIFEVGDDVVFTVDFPDVFDVDEIYRIGKHTHGQFAVHKNEELICWCGDRVFDQEFRHATDLEIKAGKRL